MSKLLHTIKNTNGHLLEKDGLNSYQKVLNYAIKTR